jgi:hypothetical protein
VPLQGSNSLGEAVDKWTRALDALPKEGLTPAEQKQKDQYESELQAAKKKLRNREDGSRQPEGMETIHYAERDKLPWMRAMAILPGLAASFTWNSSVRGVHTYPPSVSG